MDSFVDIQNRAMPSSIQEVKKHHEMRWLGLPGVVSVGIGLNEARQPAIVIGLKGPNPTTESQLPSMVEGYPVEVRVVGTVKAE